MVTCPFAGDALVPGKIASHRNSLPGVLLVMSRIWGSPGHALQSFARAGQSVFWSLTHPAKKSFNQQQQVTMGRGDGLEFTG